MGSIIHAIQIPVGSADDIITGFINSINTTLKGLGTVAGDVLHFIGS
ncbi:hypothetical protein P9209_25645 [Prescottella defluvii]|nr:hypothetical protein P9209_25645 [Prescottella defluvii]